MMMIQPLLNSTAMKKSIILISALSTFAIFGCEKEVATPTNVTTKNIQILTSVDDNVTKATWVDGEGFQWESTADEAQFMLGVIDDTNATTSNSTAVSVGGDKSATVTVAAPASFEAAYLFYPYSKLYNPDANSAIAAAWFNLDNNQTQSVAGAMESMLGKVVMSSKTAITASGENYTATMTCHTALARFLIFSSSGSAKSVQSVSIERLDGGNVWGQMHIIRHKNGTTTTEWSGVGTSTNKVTLGTAMSLSGITSKDQTKGIYMGLRPGTYAGYCYTVKMTDDTEYQFYSGSNKTFSEGTIHNIYLNLDKATSVIPSLSKTYLTNIDSAGETIPSAATLSLTINGTPSSDVPADMTAYGLSLTCTGGATATVTNAAGNVQIVFPENPLGTTRDYTLTASWMGEESSITFTQDASLGGATQTYTYTFDGWQAGANQSFVRNISAEGSDESNWFILLNGIVDDLTGLYPDDPWDVVRYGFELTPSELTSLKDFVKLDFEKNGTQMRIWIKGFNANTTGSARVFDKYFKESSGSPRADYVHVQFTQAKNYAPGANMWPDLTVDYSGSYYGPGWAATEFPSVTAGASNSSYQFTIPTACTERWQCQLKLATNLPALSSGKTYDFSATVEASQIPGAFRIQFGAAGLGFPVDNDYTLDGVDTPKVLSKQFTDSSIANATLIFDFGYAPAGTTVTITNIVIAEHVD